MAATEQEQSPRGHVLARIFYSHASQLIIPTSIERRGEQDGVAGAERAKSLLRDGVGLVIIYTHPSRTDTHRLMGLWRDNEYATPPCLIPIAYHQMNLAARISAWPTGVEFHGIVTKETVARGKNKGHEEGYGSIKFLEVGIQTLSRGGIVLLAPSSTRTTRLTMPDGIRPTDMLLNTAQRKGVPFALMSTGFEINGVTSYEHANGFNFFRRYTLRTGNTFTNREILEQLERFRTERGLQADSRRPFNDTDQWLFETQLPSLVPVTYHP